MQKKAIPKQVLGQTWPLDVSFQTPVLVPLAAVHLEGISWKVKSSPIHFSTFYVHHWIQTGFF